MSTTDRRIRRKQVLRQKILDVSREILLSQGFAALTMRRVAEAIDYSAAAIYLHFQSREQIAQELCFAGLRQLYERLQSVTGKDSATRLSGYARAYLEYAQSDPETYRLIFMADPQLTKAVFTHRESGGAAEGALGLIVTAFTELHTGSKKTGVSPMELAELFWAGLHGLASLRIACSRALTSDELRLAQIFTAEITKIEEKSHAKAQGRKGQDRRNCR
ncbi:MAG: TetR/AcrR family transcriptional regulator [Verrucomicrobia bacterium]|nr:TetR/AcrR family transcriptional regulator [Verrucomicrobiota bacterium]